MESGAPENICGHSTDYSDLTDIGNITCWRETNGYERCVLHRDKNKKSIDELSIFLSDDQERLDGAIFRGSNINDVDLSDSILVGADFTDSILSDIDFTNSNMKKSKFENANISDCKFDDAILWYCRFNSADIVGCSFQSSKLNHANFTDAELSHFEFEDTIASDSIFKETDLIDIVFGNSKFNHVDFTGCFIERANFSNTNLWRSDFTDALVHAEFRHADLSESILDDLTCKRNDLMGADLTGAQLYGADLTDSILTDVAAREAQLRGTTLENSILTRADLREASLVEADLYQAQLANIRINNQTDFGSECSYDVNKDSPGVAEEVSPLEAATWVYRRLQKLHESNVIAKKAREYHILKEEAQRLNKKGSWTDSWTTWFRGYLVPTVSYYLHRHGESISRLLGVSGGLILVCGIAYSFAGIARSNPETTYQLTQSDFTSTGAVASDLINGLYFSIITFSTIGYGDFYPDSPISRLLVGIESLAGALFIALFVFVLGRRVAR